MSIGKGAVYAASIKQKLNTTKIAELELVGVSYGIPKRIWTRYFVQAQGYNVDDVYVYQNNQSAVLLDTNSIKYVVKSSRHIRIKYFFVIDRVRDKELKIIHCTTKEMVANFSTKPLQGILFATHRNTVLEISQDDMPRYRKNI